VQHFWVTLESMTGDLAKLPDGLKVRLDVTKGRGRFMNPTVHIPPGDSVAETPAELRSRQGGAITLLARAAADGIEANEQPYTFALAPHATKLEVLPSSTSALANGLDPIRLTIKAIEELASGSHVMTAAQEAMDQGRQVSFRFENGTCWFAGKATQVTIPAAQSTADILLFCSRPAGELKVLAEAENGLEETIIGHTTVGFHLPWTQLLLAVLGAIVFPAIWRQGWTRVLVGAVVGLVIYTAFFFGAVATGEFSLGSVLITATKLPTENVLASFVLGILAYLAVGKLLPDKPGTTGPSVFVERRGGIQPGGPNRRNAS
jgi:hypothetical protein